jgi:two-component system phosphate regulon sensor histidine kinase PhoR
MNSRRRHTSAYRIRLFGGFALVVGMLAVAWVWSLSAPLDAAVRTQQEQRLTELARSGAVAIAPTSGATLARTVADLGAGSEVRVTVVAADGTVLADSQETTATLENHGNRPEVRSALAGRTGTDVRRSASQQIERMYVAVPATLADGQLVAFRTSESLAQIAALAAESRRYGLIVLGVALALAALAAWRFVRSVALPVETLADASRAMATGDLASPIPQISGPLGPLAEALVSLREQLRERVEALDAERQTLRVALDGLADGILLLNNDRVELVNRSFAAMFRLLPSEALGRHVAELGLPGPIEAAIMRHRGATPSAVDLGPDPFRRYQRLLAVPLGQSGDTRRLIAVADVTDRMRLDAVRRDFAANASHELKTPAASILLLAESAQNAAADGDSEQAVAFVGQIADEARRLRRLVNELLDLSRLEAAPSTEEVADVRRAVELALAAHRRSATERGLALSADLHAVTGFDVAVRCSSTDLAVALDNLLANAIAYTEAGSVVVAVEADERTVAIAVTDTGIGIPEADIGRIFERFYRVDRARSRTSGGTGLGLALVKNVLESCGGTVGVQSTVGQGTTITLRLPRVL